jgi:hypothetical protein
MVRGCLSQRTVASKTSSPISLPSLSVTRDVLANGRPSVVATAAGKVRKPVRRPYRIAEQQIRYTFLRGKTS